MKKNNTNEKEELIDLYDIEGNLISTKERNEVNSLVKNSFLERGQIQYHVKSVVALILDENNNMLLTQRGNTYDSAGLIDKTVTGHVSSGESFDDAMLRELFEEIGIQGIITKNQQDFKKGINSIDTYQNAVLQLFDYIKGFSVEINKGNIIYKRGFNTNIYVGIFNGEISTFPDGTTTKTIKIPFDIILKEIKKNQKMFTSSLGTMIEKYGNLILSKIM